MTKNSVRLCAMAAVAASFGLARSAAASGAVYEEVYEFPGGRYINNLVAKDGALYGATEGGGSTACSGGCGTLFKLTTQGVLTTLYSFPSSTPFPFGLTSLFSNFYVPGANFISTISAAGKQTRLVTPPAARGQEFSTMIADGSMLAGVASIGGLTSSAFPKGAGTVFTLKKSGTAGAYQVLYSFTGSADGGYPYVPPIDVNGTLYGVTGGGGANGDGVFYSISPTGAESVLMSFDSPDTAVPTPPVYANGKFYFGVYNGTVSNTWTLDSMDTAGNVTVLHTFTRQEGRPITPVTFVNGTIYGATDKVFYSLDATGAFQVLHLINGKTTPFPSGPMVLIGRYLYGAAARPGGSAYVYRLTP